MKTIFVCLVLLLFSACSMMTPPPLPDLQVDITYPGLEKRCGQMFVQGNWQLVHSITFEMANGHGTTLLGATVLDGDSIKTGLMSVEGFVLFEAELDKERKLYVNRALPPFDNEEFALGLMGDVQTVFCVPAERNPVMGTLVDGDFVCRYKEVNGQITDVIPGADGSTEMNVYSLGSRSKTVTADNFTTIGNEIFPENIQLTAFGLRGYTLKMKLISAVMLPQERQ